MRTTVIIAALLLQFSLADLAKTASSSSISNGRSVTLANSSLQIGRRRKNRRRSFKISKSTKTQPSRLKVPQRDGQGSGAGKKSKKSTRRLDDLRARQRLGNDLKSLRNNKFVYHVPSERCVPVNELVHSVAYTVGHFHDTATDCENNAPYATLLFCYDREKKFCFRSSGKHSGRLCFRTIDQCHDYQASTEPLFFYDEVQKKCIQYGPPMVDYSTEQEEKPPTKLLSLDKCNKKHSIQPETKVIFDKRLKQCVEVQYEVRTESKKIYHTMDQCINLTSNVLFCYNIEHKICRQRRQVNSKAPFRSEVCFADRSTCQAYSEKLKIRFVYDENEGRCLKTNNLTEYRPLYGKHYFTKYAQCARFKMRQLENKSVQCWQFVTGKNLCQTKVVEKAMSCDTAQHLYSDKADCVRRILDPGQQCFLLDIVLEYCHETWVKYQRCNHALNMYDNLDQCQGQLTSRHQWYVLDQFEEACLESDFDHENLPLFPNVNICEEYKEKLFNPQPVDDHELKFMASEDGGGCSRVAKGRGIALVAFSELTFYSPSECQKHADQLRDLHQRRTRYYIKNSACQPTVQHNRPALFKTVEECRDVYSKLPYTIQLTNKICALSEEVPADERGRMFSSEEECRMFQKNFPSFSI